MTELHHEQVAGRQPPAEEAARDGAAAHRHPHDHDHTHTHEPDHAHPRGLRGLLAELVRPHSHDTTDSLDDALTGSDTGIRAVKLSLVGLGITAVLQLFVVVLSGSVALLADTLHNFADAATALPLWLAFALGRRAPTRRYTYGYGRAEDLAGVFVVLMIAATAALAAIESLRRLLDPQPVTHLGWVAAAALIGVVGNEAVAQYRIRAGQRIGSAALVADGYHARTDGLASLAVLLGAAGVWAGFHRADPLVGLGITVVILFVLKDAARQVWHRLMDAVDPDVLAQAERAARAAEGVEAVTQLRARWMGHRLLADVHLTANCELTLAEAHAVAERARHAMLHDVPKLTDVTVHVDPCGHDATDPHGDLIHHDARLRAR